MYHLLCWTPKIDRVAADWSIHEAVCNSALLPADGTLTEAVGQLSLFLCQETYVDSYSNSTLLVYFSGVIGFSASGFAFERPCNYTPKPSGLIYCIRLCMLEAALPLFAHSTIGWQAGSEPAILDI